MKGVILGEAVSNLYCSFFLKENEDYLKSKALLDFYDTQLHVVMDAWRKDDILSAYGVFF